MRQEGSKHRETSIYTDLPTSTRILPDGTVDAERPCSVFLSWATTQMHNPDTEGTLGLRWAFNGRRYFQSRDGRYAVDDTSYLLFNHGQIFSSVIDSPTVVECYTVCWQPELVQDALRSLVSPADRLLDDPMPSWQPVTFVEKTYRHDDVVSPLLFRLQNLRDCEGATHGWFEEQFRFILAALLQSHRNVFREVENVPALRASTRLELYRRLHQARDFMEAGMHRPLTLPQIAEEACFSPHHFLRLFKQVFHETPHQYMTRRRLERAQNLLLQSDVSVTDICLMIGFESLGSFSWLFRRRVGMSPEQFRAQSRGKVWSMTAVSERVPDALQQNISEHACRFPVAANGV